MVVEHPILFNSAMVLAIIADNKTCTRRLNKLVVNLRPDDYKLLDLTVKTIKNKSSLTAIFFDNEKEQAITIVCPYGEIGSYLWVRETWRESLTEDGHECFGFLADRKYSCGKSMPADSATALKWKPSIHMPRRACRLILEIIDIRLQRLTDIDAASAKAEGINVCSENSKWQNYMPNRNTNNWLDNPIDSFASLWSSINGASSWSNNPWVWVIDFKKVATVCLDKKEFV